MGVVSSHKELVVATVNYSGILYSPFEFYSQESYLEEEKMSQCFRKLLEETYQNFDPKTFKWGLGKIDQKLQKERYAVIYRQEAGVQQNKLLNEEQFRKRWQQQFEKAKATGKVEATADEIKNTQNFDVHCYRTFIYYLYNEKNLAKAPQLNPQKYKEFKKTFFTKSFLNEKQKIKQTFRAMEQQQVDVFFFQQSSKQFEDLLKQKKQFISFRSEKSTSLIVLRKHKFAKIHDSNKLLSHISQQFVKGLNFNDDSSICFADNFIFLNLHLSSKKDKNPAQIKKLAEDLERLRQIYPMCEIIAGGDLNSFLSPQMVSKQFHVFPDKEDLVTTMKKRTWIQPQVNKADELSRECKDSIISTLPFEKPRIVTILGLDYKKIRYIPNQEHPCDHFVVTTNIIVRK